MVENTKSWISKVTMVVGRAAACSALAIGSAHASEILYGTALYFDQSPVSCCSPIGSVGLGFHEGVASTSRFGEAIGFGQTFGSARAIAAPNLFEVGLSIETADGSGRAGALAASRYTIAGAAPGDLIPGTITIDGTFTSSVNAGWIVSLFVVDFRGHFLAALDIGSALPRDPVTGTTAFGEPPVPTFTADYCADPLQTNCSFTNAGFGDWAGSFTLPFVVPNIDDNGVIVELWAQLSAQNGGKLDFLNSATLNFTPSEGVEVVLASGQTFGTSSQIPEPATLALLGLALAGLGFSRRKRTAS